MKKYKEILIIIIGFLTVIVGLSIIVDPTYVTYTDVSNFRINAADIGLVNPIGLFTDKSVNYTDADTTNPIDLFTDKSINYTDVDTISPIDIFTNDSIDYTDTNKILVINSSEETLLTVKSLGFKYDNISISNMKSVNLTDYDAIIVDNIYVQISKEEEIMIKNALDSGVSFLWIGEGIEGSDGQTLPSIFGIQIAKKIIGTEADSEDTEDGQSESYVKWSIHKILCGKNTPIEPKGASVESYIYDRYDNILYPAITYYQKDSTTGRSVYIAYDSYDLKQYSVLAHYIQRIVYKPIAVLNPYPNRYKSAALVRIEDVNAKQTGQDYIERLNDTIYWLGSHQIPTNLGISPIFINGSEKADNMHRWRKDFSVGDLSNLKNVLSDAIYKFNGYVITHGYSHQYGNGDDDYTVFDQEFFDEDNNSWLQYSEQFDRIKKAREEIQMIFPEKNLTTISLDYSCTIADRTYCWVNNTNSYSQKFELHSKYSGYPALLHINWYYDRPNIWINGKELSTSWLDSQQYNTQTLHVTSDYFIPGINTITINTDTIEGGKIDYVNITFIKGFNSTVFEPPHYISNRDTYLAERNLGYRHNMADDYIYPNDLVFGLLNIPETGDDISFNVDQKEIDAKIDRFKSIYDSSGIYLIYYHVFTDDMHKAFKSIMSNILIHKYVWYPNIGELADWWEGKDKIVFNTIRDDNEKKVVVNIKSPKKELKNVTMKFILSTGTDIIDVKLDGKSVGFTTETISAYSQFVYVVIPSASRNNIILYYS